VPTSPSAASSRAEQSSTLAESATPNGSSGANAATAPASTEARAGLEINYLKFVADHHLMGVMMAELCVQKAVHAELRQHCQMAAQHQQEETELVLSLLRQYYGIEYEPAVEGEGRMTQLERLSGAEFEIRFLEEFPRHHKTVIQRSQPLATNAVHEEVRQMAANIITNQTQGAIQLVTWKCVWYGDCNPVAGFIPAT
jgi:uncharacterized protein (DUF305 family)